MALALSTDLTKLTQAFGEMSKDELFRVGTTLSSLADSAATYAQHDLARTALKSARSIYSQKFMGTKADALLAIEPAPEVSAVADGTYTVVLSGEDDYATLRVETVANGNLAGRRILSLLTGSDNERSFAGFAFINDLEGLKFWKKAEGEAKYLRAKAAWAILSNSDSVAGYQEAYAMKSGRCSRCGRKLTVPASLHRGMGPECATK